MLFFFFSSRVIRYSKVFLGQRQVVKSTFIYSLGILGSVFYACVQRSWYSHSSGFAGFVTIPRCKSQRVAANVKLPPSPAIVGYTMLPTVFISVVLVSLLYQKNFLCLLKSQMCPYGLIKNPLNYWLQMQYSQTLVSSQYVSQ